MPGFVTHHIFGINAFHGLPKGNAKDIIRKHNKAYALGLQGPDLLSDASLHFQTDQIVHFHRIFHR
mgnify:CR=1 FL=1